jgi:WD40 repeat protein
MANAIASERLTPFESASELREAHARLLEALDVELARDAATEGEIAALAHLEPEIRRFVERGAATGAFIEEITERTACQTLLDYWVSSLSHAGTHMRGIRLARFDGDQLPDLKDKACPYVGLEAFRDPTFFFGREADIQALVAQLHDAPLVVVAGTSGSGKSSLVIAGVLPEVATERSTQALCIVPPFVPGNAVLEHLADAVLQGRGNKIAEVAAEAAALRQDPQRLSAMVGGEQARPALITIDQFEEVFTLSAAEDREALVANLGRLLEAGRGHRVILTVREEFKSRIVELRALSPYLDKAWYSMRPMGYDALRAAIEKPAKQQNLQFQSGIVDDLVKKVLGQPAALPLLQFALQSLWEARDRNRVTWEVYRKIGDPLNALKTSADRFYDGLAPQTQDEVKRVLLELVRVDELLEAYRQPVPKSRLLRPGKANTEDVLRLLADNHYIRITPGSSGTDQVVEVKHEALVRNWPLLVGWIGEKRMEVRRRLALTEAAKRWADNGKPEQGLLTGWQLQAAKAQSNLSDLEKEFVQASDQAIDRKQAALRRQTRVFFSLAVVASVAALIAVVTSIIALQEKGAIKRRDVEEMHLQEEANRIQVQQAAEKLKNREQLLQALRLQPLNYMDDQRDLALLVSIEAMRKAPGELEVLRSLLSILTTNLELKSVFPGQAGKVRAVRFSPDRKVLASASRDETNNEGVIVMRHVARGRMLYPPLRGHRGTIYELAFSTDGKTLASASDDKTVRLWDVETGELKRALSSDSEIFGVAIRSDGTLLAAAGADGFVTLWDLKSYEKTVLAHSESRADKPRGEVRRVAFSSDGALLASGGEDGRIILWDVGTGKQAGEPLMVNHEVFGMAFSHDGKTIASGSQDGDVDLWNVAARSKERKLFAHSRGVYGVAFGPDDTLLATVAEDRNVYVHDLNRSEDEPRQLRGYAGRFFSVDFANDGKLATGTDKGMVIVWDLLRDNPVVRSVNPPTNRPAMAAFTVDEKTLVVSHWGAKLQFWSTENSLSSPRSVDASRQTTIVLSLFAPNGKDLVTVGSDNSIELWDLTKPSPIDTLVQPGKDEILTAAYSADSRTLAISVNHAQNQGEIWLLDMPGRKRTVFTPFKPSPDNPVYALAFSPKGNLLAIGQGRDISVWNLDTAEQVKLFDHTERVFCLAFNPDGKLLASGGKDGAVRLWDMEGGSGASLDSHRGPVMSVAFSPDGKRLASGSMDKSVLLWDVDARLPLTPPIAHGGAVRSLAFSPSGRSMVSSAGDGTISLWTLSIPSLLFRACQIARRNLTDTEWKRFFGDEPFRVTCPTATDNEADALALTGDHVGAERLFEQALGAALQANEPEGANEVCWLGSTDGFAMTVKPACERAVELAPEGMNYRDSRGLARALTGDKDGAIEDFIAVVENLKRLDLRGYGQAILHRREGWIAALKEGHNPFDERLLNELRTE